MDINDSLKKEKDEVESIFEELLDLDRYNKQSESIASSSIANILVKALTATNVSLKKTTEENLLNIIREILFSQGIDIAKNYPSIITVKSKQKKIINIKKGSEFLALISSQDRASNNKINPINQEQYCSFINFHDILMFPVDLEVKNNSTNSIDLSLQSNLEISKENFNNLLFYVKGSFFYKFINKCLEQKRFPVFINSVYFCDCEFQFMEWSSLPFISFEKQNQNLGIEKLLNFLLCEDLGRFFKLKLNREIPRTNHISIQIPIEEGFSDSNQIFLHYYPLVNLFTRDSLPWKLDVNKQVIQTLDSKDIIYSIEDLKLMTKEKEILVEPMMHNINQNDNSNKFFWTTFLMQEYKKNIITLAVQVMNMANEGLEDNKAISRCIMNNKNEDIEKISFNNSFVLWNNQEVEEIFLTKVSYLKKDLSDCLLGKNHLSLRNFQNYLNNYKKEYSTTDNFSHLDQSLITNLWQSIKSFATQIGNPRNSDYLKIQILQEKVSKEERITMTGKKYFIQDIVKISLSLDNKKYNNILNYFFQDIVNSWKQDAQIILQ